MDTMQIRQDKRWRGDPPVPVPAGMQTLTRKEVADLFGVDIRVVTRYAATGVLTKYVTPVEGVRKAGRIVFDRAEARKVAKMREGTAKHGSEPEPDGNPRRPNTAPRPRRW